MGQKDRLCPAETSEQACLASLTPDSPEVLLAIGEEFKILVADRHYQTETGEQQKCCW